MENSEGKNTHTQHVLHCSAGQDMEPLHSKFINILKPPNVTCSACWERLQLLVTKWNKQIKA